MKCNYGCGRSGTYTLSNGKVCCEKNYQSCPENRRKNSKGLTKAHKDGILYNRNYTEESRYKQGAGNRGKTAYTNPNSIHRAKYSPDDVFVERSLVTNKTIKSILVAEGWCSCSTCGLTNWLDREIILELHHINGNSRDNRKVNLQLLCPNCHSQTKTFRGKNVNNGKVKVTDEELVEAFESEGNIRRALLKVGLAPKGGNYFRVKKLIDNSIKL